MPRGRKKPKQCRMCKKKFTGKHLNILERDLAAITTLEENNFKPNSNEKLIICLDCVAKHNLRQPRYRNNVKKRRANSNMQQRVAAENRAANKEANRNVLRPETLSGILDAMDEQDRNSV